MTKHSQTIKGAYKGIEKLPKLNQYRLKTTYAPWIVVYNIEITGEPKKMEKIIKLLLEMLDFIDDAI